MLAAPDRCRARCPCPFIGTFTNPAARTQALDSFKQQMQLMISKVSAQSSSFPAFGALFGWSRVKPRAADG